MRQAVKLKISSNRYVIYLLKFAAIFCLLYFGSLAVIGLSTPGNNYSQFVDNYLDYISLLRRWLLLAGKGLLSVFGIATVFTDEHTLTFADDTNSGIRMVYSCIGYGVMSFWAAFVLANTGSVWYKSIWLIGGWVALCFLNVMRIFWLMVSIRNGWPVPFGLDHHTVFNIAAYALIFLMIYLYDKRATRNSKSTATPRHYRPIEVQ